jgi:hypothetical protein
METIATSLPSSTPEVQSEPTGAIGGEYKEYAPLYERFDVNNRNDERINRNLEIIWKYAKERAETKDKDSILWEITKLRNKLGESPYGSASYSKILSYISTYNQMREAERMLKEMEVHA